MIGELSPTHWLIVIAVLVLLFGAKRLPDAARSLGRSARVLKGEMRGLHEDEHQAQPPTPASPEPTTQPQPMVAPEADLRHAPGTDPRTAS